MVKKVALLASHVAASLRSSLRQYVQRGMNSEKLAVEFGFAKKEVPWYKRTIKHYIRIRHDKKIFGPAFFPDFPKMDEPRQSQRRALFFRAFAEISLRSPLSSRRSRRRRARLASQVAFLSLHSAAKVR